MSNSDIEKYIVYYVCIIFKKLIHVFVCMPIHSYLYHNINFDPAFSTGNGIGFKHFSRHKILHQNFSHLILVILDFNIY